MLKSIDHYLPERIKKHPVLYPICGFLVLLLLFYLAVFEPIWSQSTDKLFFKEVYSLLSGELGLIVLISSVLFLIAFVVNLFFLAGLAWHNFRISKFPKNIEQQLVTAKAKFKTQVRDSEDVQRQLEVVEFDNKDLKEALSAHKKATLHYKMKETLHKLNCAKETIGLTVQVVYVEYKDIDLATEITNTFLETGWTVEGPEMFQGGKLPKTSGRVLVQSGNESLADTVLSTMHGGDLLGELSSNSSPDPSLKLGEVVITLFPKVT